MTVNDTERGVQEGGERERKEFELKVKEYKGGRTPPPPTAAPQIEGRGDKTLCGNQRSRVSWRSLKER